jgi:hypothetical protein
MSRLVCGGVRLMVALVNLLLSPCSSSTSCFHFIVITSLPITTAQDELTSANDVVSLSNERNAEDVRLQLSLVCEEASEARFQQEQTSARVSFHLELSFHCSSFQLIIFALYREELTAAMNDAQQQLAMLKRQGPLGQMYPSTKSVMDP